VDASFSWMVSTFDLLNSDNINQDLFLPHGNRSELRFKETHSAVIMASPSGISV
jgi:hypothetical protein